MSSEYKILVLGAVGFFIASFMFFEVGYGLILRLLGEHRHSSIQRQFKMIMAEMATVGVISIVVILMLQTITIGIIFWVLGYSVFLIISVLRFDRLLISLKTEIKLIPNFHLGIGYLITLNLWLIGLIWL